MKKIYAQYTGTVLTYSGTVAILEELLEGEPGALRFVRHFAAAVDEEDALIVCKAAVEAEYARQGRIKEECK